MSFIEKSENQTYIQDVLLFFSFLSGPEFYLGLCVGFSCQVFLVSLTLEKFLSLSLAFMA